MYLVQTVQTSWRPQLPLPKEVNVSDDNTADHNKSNSLNDMERHLHHKKDNNSLNGSQISNMSGSQHGSSSSKKWSFGRLFRSKKKEVESASSSEEDRKAGFSPANKFPRNSGSKSKAKGKSNRNSKLIGAGFDHIVVNPQQLTPPPVKRPPLPQNMGNEFFLPFETATTAAKPEPFYHNQQQQHPQQSVHYSQQYLLHPQQMQLSRSSNSLDRRALNAVSLSPKIKSHSAQRLAVGPDTQMPVRSSSEEELISLNSSTFSKYRSDESIHSGGQGQNGQSRRSRAARNERYYKRLSRDGEVSHGQVPVMYAPQPAQRWKTQPVPLSVYNAPPVAQATHQPSKQQPNHASQSQSTTSQRLRNAGSLQHVTPYIQWGQVQKQPKNLQNSVNDTKRSISYDSQIHLHNANGRLQTKPLPPPPPPRDPTRRLNVSGHVANSSSSELRPLSYAFDVNGLPTLPTTGLNGRYISDDKIWASQAPLYQSAQSLNVTPATNTIGYQQPTTHRRFITRAERDAQPGKKSLPNGLDMHYIADATPRSRKPIHLLEQPDDLLENLPPPSSGIVRTTKSGLPSTPPKAVANDFWKRLDETAQIHSPPANLTQPKSAFATQHSDARHNTSPMYSEVNKPHRKPVQAIKTSPEPKSVDEVDHVVCGSLHIKPSPDGATKSYVEIRNKDAQKSHSMPNHYQRRSGSEIFKAPNKYEEYVAEKREQHHNLADYPPTPPQRKLSTPLVVTAPKAASQPAPPVYIPHKKPANLEEAISELEAIYKSLRIGNEPPIERKERVPTPSDFEKFALARADSYDDDESPTGEADPINDDVAYRSIKLANLQHKTTEKQPPFGIPIGPIVPSPHNDYLHVTPDKNKKVIVVQKRVPDIIKDDLAVRALRKDAPGPKPHYIYPSGSLQKKNRATRTQSANIYSLIQRDAAKPSGGDFFSFMELTKSIDRSGSMSDLQHGEGPADIPATLQLLLNLKEQDQELSAPKKSPSIPFRHPSQGGAICQLPEKLTSTPASNDDGYKPVPMPRKLLSPEPSSGAAGHQMEDALNKIAKDAQESSAKLTKELRELRKEALITASRPKVALGGEAQIEQDLQEIEAVSEAAKRCGQMLLENLPDSNESFGESSASTNKPRKLYKEGKLIKAIDQVSEAANAVCEKILKDIVTTEPPVVVQDAIKVQNVRKEENLVMPNLIKKLDPVKSDEIEAIARRCMRQISELSETTDYDNLGLEEVDSQPACNDLSAQAGDVNQMIVEENLPSSIVSEKQKRIQASREMDEIDRIMQECEAQVQSEGGASTGTATVTTATVGFHQKQVEDKTTAPSLTTSGSSSNKSAPGKCNSSTTASSFSSSSDCLAKSSSPSGGRRFSSSITSFNPYSSSDYIKSPSSDFHAPSTDPIKTFSTTSYDVASTSETPNITTNSTFSYSPSPPLNLTPISERAAGTGAKEVAVVKRERSSSPSQYNSSEELAMIFGIEENPKNQQQRGLRVQQQHQIHPDESLV